MTRANPFSRLAPVAAAAITLATAAPSLAQLAPDREYYGINRAIPMTVTVPGTETGDVEIALLEPVTAAVVEKRPAGKGGVDLAGLFPVLWTSSAPRTLYAQLLVGGKKIGPAVALIPMITPQSAARAPGGVKFTGTGDVYSGLRAWVDRDIVFDTSLGEIEIAMRPDMAPNTVNHIVELVEGGFYTDIVVHRIVRDAGGTGFPFVVQFGDPTGTGTGGPGVVIDLEPSTLPHDFGVISMARSPDPNFNGSQVFLCLSREGTRSLDGQYTSFGQLVRGADTLIKMEKTPADAKGRPNSPPVIKRAYTVPAAPYGEGPKPPKRPDEAPVSR